MLVLRVNLIELCSTTSSLLQKHQLPWKSKSSRFLPNCILVHHPFQIISRFRMEKVEAKTTLADLNIPSLYLITYFKLFNHPPYNNLLVGSQQNID